MKCPPPWLVSETAGGWFIWGAGSGSECGPGPGRPGLHSAGRCVGPRRRSCSGAPGPWVTSTGCKARQIRNPWLSCRWRSAWCRRPHYGEGQRRDVDMHRVNYPYTFAVVAGFESFVLVYSNIFSLCGLCDIYFLFCCVMLILYTNVHYNWIENKIFTIKTIVVFHISFMIIRNVKI